MDISQEQARESLEQVRDTSAGMRRMAAHAGADVLFIVWGVIWAVGFVLTQFIPPALDYRNVTGVVVGLSWTVLVAIGIGVSIYVGRTRTAVRTRADSRVGWLFWVVYLYVDIILLLMLPFLQIQGHEQSQMFWRHIGAVSAVVPMFCYVLMGLWLDLYMVWLGLFVTALTLFGVYLVQEWFFLWMAFAGGGTLIATGILVRKRWK